MTSSIFLGQLLPVFIECVNEFQINWDSAWTNSLFIALDLDDVLIVSNFERLLNLLNTLTKLNIQLNLNFEFGTEFCQYKNTNKLSI